MNALGSGRHVYAAIAACAMMMRLFPMPLGPVRFMSSELQHCLAPQRFVSSVLAALAAYFATNYGDTHTDNLSMFKPHLQIKPEQSD